MLADDSVSCNYSVNFLPIKSYFVRTHTLKKYESFSHKHLVVVK